MPSSSSAQRPARPAVPQAPSPAQQPVRRARHLIDPDDPRPRRRDPMSIGQVQKWVMSVLAVSTILHLAGGLVVAAYFLDRGVGAQIGLLVIAGVIGMLAIAVGRLIHRRSPLTGWLAAGWLPAVAGVFLILG